MGAYSPAMVMTPEIQEQAMEDIIKPTIQAMKERGSPFTGVLYAGLMIKDNKAKLLEYNVRFGDPECQVLMMRMKSDLVEVLLRLSAGEAMELEWHDETALVVVLASQGYPGSYEKGTKIGGEAIVDSEGKVVFHAGTARDGDGDLVAVGGRVLGVTASGKDVKDAQTEAYKLVDNIDWPKGFCRRDIGWKDIARLEK